MELTIQQNKVYDQIRAFLVSDASVFILRGYAGTGKTTMIKTIADYAAQSHHVLLMAPTGRAARVLQKKTELLATTIHKAIYSKACIVSKDTNSIAESEFKYVFPIRTDYAQGNIVTIVDEASMVSSRKNPHELFAFGTDNLLEDLLTYSRPHFGGKIIFVGDPAQLPPVGEQFSNALQAEYFQERGLKVVEAELTEVLRQKGESTILKNAMMLRNLLNEEKRNHLVFDEKANEVEMVPIEHFLNKYLDCRKQSGQNNSVVICYSNKSANKYNKDIRTALYGPNAPINTNDVLQIIQNNYKLNRMNGEFVPILEIGSRIKQSAPVYAQIEGKRQQITITLTFLQITIPNGEGYPVPCMLLEDLLTSDNKNLSIDETRALYINFCMRHPLLKQGSESFISALLEDEYYNAVRAKYGYAVTGHKCQGGEWGNAFVDYSDRTGLDDDSLRWAYTTTTRAQKALYFTNLPHITPFSKFRIDPIQKCKTINSECRILDEVDVTPFHGKNIENGVRAKYHCIANNLQGTPYRILDVTSHRYLETYKIQTPDGIETCNLYYKDGAIFLPKTEGSSNEHSVILNMMLNNEQAMSYKFDYKPSNELLNHLYNFIRSACDTAMVEITNVVEHIKDYHVVYYLRTSDTFSYITIYINADGFITYAKPMSLKGTDDFKLQSLIEVINSYFE